MSAGDAEENRRFFLHRKSSDHNSFVKYYTECCTVRSRQRKYIKKNEIQENQINNLN